MWHENFLQLRCHGFDKMTSSKHLKLLWDEDKKRIFLKYSVGFMRYRWLFVDADFCDKESFEYVQETFMRKYCYKVQQMES